MKLPRKIKDIDFFSLQIWVHKRDIDFLSRINFKIKPYLIKEWFYHNKKIQKFDKNFIVKDYIQINKNSVVKIYPKISRKELINFLKIIKEAY